MKDRPISFAAAASLAMILFFKLDFSTSSFLPFPLLALSSMTLFVHCGAVEFSENEVGS